MNKVRLTSGKILYDDQIDLLATFNGTLSIHPTIKHRKDNISQYNDI